MASSKRWASIISSIASFLHFFIIILQVPVFRVPCRTGTCTSPIEVMSSHLMATELYPAFGPKALLYPGAIARSYIKNRTFPSYSKLPKLYNLTNLRKTSASTDLRHLEILTGSYLAVAGAVLGLVRLDRTSLFGTLLILWGFVREVILKNSADMNSARSIHIYPVTMCIALLCAFLAIRKDVRKLIRSNTVGIIGGISVNSALNFLKKLVHGSSKEGKDCFPFVLCSDPVLNKELLSHERNSCPFPSRHNEKSPSDHSAIAENLQNKRVFLEKSGVQCIVMPCHILHSWHDEVSKGCSVPFLHMGECVARELKEAKLKPLEAGSPLRIGLLASNATLAAGFYQEKLHSEGFEVVLPDKATMDHTIIPAIEALDRNDMEGAQNLLRIALQVLLVRAVNTVILASEEMRDVLPEDDPLLKKCIDPMDALARSTIKWAQAAEKGSENYQIEL
ncbi:hypothetical protein D5086_006408 [Populus alba]|uniref:Uncharacterized protein n=1 Tax=Populus alba TaxID=43335 RepID=A0ACC4CKJ9_POPAL